MLDHACGRTRQAVACKTLLLDQMSLAPPQRARFCGRRLLHRLDYRLNHSCIHWRRPRLRDIPETNAPRPKNIHRQNTPFAMEVVNFQGDASRLFQRTRAPRNSSNTASPLAWDHLQIRGQDGRGNERNQSLRAPFPCHCLFYNSHDRCQMARRNLATPFLN